MKRGIAGVAAAVMLCATSCVHRIERKSGTTIHTINDKAPFLKVHMPDGKLYVLADWRVDETTKHITGTGDLFDADRELEKTGSFSIAMDDVAMYETNTIESSPGVAAMAVISGLSVAVTAFCIANPKSCFGSCPTFYAPSDDNGRPVLQAEGFSDSIAPSLERNDIDALWQTTGHAGRTTITMTNEAYETHVVKQVDLLAVPRPAHGRVLATDDHLYIASTLTAPTACIASEGSCLDALSTVDGRERSSTTDGEDLATRETIQLAFPRGDGATGQRAIVIAARQSLVTTFLLYQGLAYLGADATRWLATLGSMNADARVGGRALHRLVGGIEVQVRDGDGWRTVDEVYETGPIATDVHLVLLPVAAAGDEIRLVLQRGGWRIDSVALATITGEAQPIRIAPSKIRGTLGAEYAGARKPASRFPIITLPGDRYELEYTLPATDAAYELFLDSRGYYLEWMRDEWLADQNTLSAIKLFADPEAMLRELAPAYKRVEPHMEEIFWRSRYARP
ncbi:MAG TPA: hypothetical protein VMZ53_17780 [Kofleriaceae bacterium]|nr:hypothetical protein [Kofleriaceae bacterium]